MLGERKLSRQASHGYNLVEVLVTLTIASVITITLVNFVNDIDMRHKVAIARADVNRISQAAHIAEAELSRVTTLPGNSLGVLNLTSNSKLAWTLQSKLLDIPLEDPWGNRFYQVERSGMYRYERATGTADLTTASPYIIDEGLGRVISAGPDGIIDTRIGQDPSDSESDIVIEYRHKPWIFYNTGGRMYVNSADGGANPTSTAGIDMGLGVNAQVSPDGLRFAAIVGNELILGTLAWALESEGASPKPRIDSITIAGPARQRTLVFRNNQWISETGALAVNDQTFPIWLPDSSGIVFSVGGHIYRFDGARGSQSGPARGEVLRLTDQALLNGTGSSSGKRILSTTRRYGVYVDPDLALYMTISGDGKIAYRNTAGGLSVVLGDGTARRTLKQAPNCDFRPLAWLDNNNIAYYDGQTKRLWRIAQDGTIDIPLHVAGAPTIDNVFNPVLSPDGKYLAFLTSSSKGNVAKTDGTGFVPQANNASSLEFGVGGVTMLEAPPLIWRLAPDCAGNRLFYIPTGDPSKPISNLHMSPADKLLSQSPLSVSDPELCEVRNGIVSSPQSIQAPLLEGVSALYYALSSDEKLLAVVSDKPSSKRPGNGRGGIFILPLVGSSRALTFLDLPTAPTENSYNYVAWLLN